MGLKYSCFVSYCHGQHSLMQGFIGQLISALKSELEPYLDEEVFIDEERLKPGYRYNDELALAICQSLCMVVVYSPKYENHDYCSREFEAMVRLSDRREEILGETKLPGIIIPIVLRGAENLPRKITENIHYCDFSKFTLAGENMDRNPDYVLEIGKIAKVIHENYLAITNLADQVFCDCGSFQLPPVTEITPWRPKFVNR